MNVGVLLITHGEIGEILLEAAVNILGVCPMQTTSVPAPAECDPESVLADARQALHELDSGDGVLVLTDLYGSTPSNIACRLYKNDNVRVVSGLNLPMLVRILNYPDLDIDELLHKAVTGGRDGVITCNIEGTPHAG